MNTAATPFDDGELYDVLFRDLDYGIDFYVEQARAAGGPVLDVACGTGRILLPLLRAGIDADGLDAFPSMLARARGKAAAGGFHPALYQAEMRRFRLPRRYALVIVPFNSFGHNLTQADQIRALRAFRRHLLPGGRLVFDAFLPGPELLGSPQGVPEFELEVAHPETGLPLRVYDSRTFDLVEQVQHSEMEIRETGAKGEVRRTHRSRTSVRWLYKGETELLLRAAGFRRWMLHGGFAGEPLLTAGCPLVVTAWSG